MIKRTNIELILPPVAKLRVVLLDDHLQEPILQPAALVGRHVVDLRHVVAHGEEALPARHGVCPHHGVRCCQGRADVVGRAPRRGVQLEALFASDCGQTGLGECRREGLEEPAVGGGDFVVDFAGGGPDCVFVRSAHGIGLGMGMEELQLTASRLGQLRQFQDRVVRGVWLVASICMPRISDVGRSVLPEVFGRVGRFVCCDDVDVQILVLVEVGEGMNV